MRYAARGRLAPGARPALERACNVRPTALGVVDGLVSAGWLDDLGPDGWQVHDWEEHNGAAVAKAEKDAERKREARKRRGDGAETARAARADGAGTGRYETGRDETVEEGREPDGPLPRELLPEVEKPKRTSKPVDPRHAPLVADLVEVYASARNGAKYPFGPRDARAVSTLLTQAAPDVVSRAWRRALAHQGFPTVATLSELSAHLAHFVADVASTRGPVPAESVDWAQQQTGEVSL
jgi:hypothetical protein